MDPHNTDINCLSESHFLAMFFSAIRGMKLNSQFMLCGVVPMEKIKKYRKLV